MSIIIENNEERLNDIRKIYRIATPEKLRKLIEKHFIPSKDEKKNNAEIPTPVALVDDMLSKIPKEYWTKVNKTFEPCCGKGNFVIAIFDKFFDGLSHIKSKEERCRTIMNECIYFADLTNLNIFITTEIIKCHIQSKCGLEPDYEFNYYIGDTLTLNIKNLWNTNDLTVIGNPPYSTDPSKSNTTPLYDKFIMKFIDCKQLLFVVPSRWFVGGKGLDKFRNFMLKRKDIVFIQHEDNCKKWFGNNNISIEGGVNYFLKNISYNGNCLFNNISYDLSKYDCVIHPKYHKLIDIVSKHENINKLYMGRYFNIETNDKRLKDIGNIKCYVSLQKSKDRVKFIEFYKFDNSNSFWKVITARANGKNPKFGEKFIGKPNEVHTGTYISFRVNNESEAKSLLSYFNTKFANYMLSIRKISQDISNNTCKWIPLVPLNIIWTDEKVCEYFEIDKNLYEI